MIETRFWEKETELEIKNQIKKYSEKWSKSELRSQYCKTFFLHPSTVDITGILCLAEYL
jgi:hypothetical protein